MVISKGWQAGHFQSRLELDMFISVCDKLFVHATIYQTMLKYCHDSAIFFFLEMEFFNKLAKIYLHYVVSKTIISHPPPHLFFFFSMDMTNMLADFVQTWENRKLQTFVPFLNPIWLSYSGPATIWTLSICSAGRKSLIPQFFLWFLLQMLIYGTSLWYSFPNFMSWHIQSRNIGKIPFLLGPWLWFYLFQSFSKWLRINIHNSSLIII